VGLTNAQRAERRAEVLAALRRAWIRRDRVELSLQRGRTRPRVSGVVSYVATSGAFTHLRDDDWPDDAPERLAPTLHVPVDVIRSVRPAVNDRTRARVRTSRR
jgi:hypothetical protein